MREWRARPSSREKLRATARRMQLKRYGLTPYSFNLLSTLRGGMCELSWCLNPIEVVDHDHETGKFRGLLCRAHNRALGVFERPEYFREVVAYLAQG